MSFILDALRKSENERQQQADAEFANVPSGGDAPAAPRWLWVLGALLLINVVVLLGLLLRPDTPAAEAPAFDEPVAETAAETIFVDTPVVAEAASEPSFAEQVDTARREQPRRPPPDPVPLERATPTESRPVPAPVVENPLLLPSFAELKINGTLQLPDLHIDIHVYSESPSDRFVFINMSKYKESDQLDEGPFVREITREGVVLEYRGTRFLLSRD